MKKLLLLGLMLLLMAALLMGCDKGNTPDDTTDPSTATEDATAAPTEPDGDATEPPTEEVTTDYFEANRIETVKPDTTKVPDVTVTGLGYDIYQLPIDQEWGYRYGATYLYNDDGSVDAYFACVGTNGE